MNNLNNEIIKYYKNFNEKERLDSSWGKLEFLRTLDILQRFMPDAPAVVYDIGGASGRYSCLLARMGYEVTLVDPVPLHVKQAKLASEYQPEHPLKSCLVGDARNLALENDSADVVLFMGPLYHLVKREERIDALKEAFRVLKTGGILFAVGISRFASTIDGFASLFFKDIVFRKIMEQDLRDGQHRNPTGNPMYFADTFFHHPDELRNEVSSAGFNFQKILAVESIGYVLKNFETQWYDEDSREYLLKIIRIIESEPALIGASPHIMSVAEKN